MKKIKYIAVILSFACLGMNISLAQNKKDQVKRDTITRELTVVTDKVIEIPQVKGAETFVSPMIPRLRPFSQQPIRRLVSFNPEISPIENGFITPLAKENITSPYRGFLDMGIGTMWNFRAGLGYRILSTPKDQMLLSFRHRSSFETLDDETKTVETKNVAHSNTFNFNYAHSFQPLTLHLGAIYDYSYFNYYGVYVTDQGRKSVQKDKIDTDSEAGVHSIDFKLGLHSNDNVFRVLSYKADISIESTIRDANYWGYSMKVNEFHPNLNLNLNLNKGGDFSLGLDAKVGCYNHSYTGEKNFESNFGFIENTMYDAGKSMFYAYGNPYAQLSGSTGSVDYFLKGGVGISYNSGDNDKLFLYPVAEASLTFAKTYKIYASATGRLRENTLRQTLSEMPYVAPMFMVDPGRTTLDAEAGLSAAFTQYVNLDLYGGYEMISHHHFFRPFNGREAVNQNTDDYLENIAFRPIYTDAKKLKLGARFGFNYHGIWGFMAQGEYNHWNTDLPAAMVADGMPVFVADAKVYFSPIEKLRIDINYRLKNGVQYNNIETLSRKIFDLENIHLLNARANYKLNEQLNVFLNAENLLFRTYSMMYGYPARGASLMLGVDYKF